MQKKIELPVLAVDMGGTAVKYAWIFRGRLRQGEPEFVNRQNTDVPGSLSEVLCRIGELAKKRPVCGIAVSMPGIIDTKRKVAHSGGVYGFIHDEPLARELEERTGVSCWIGNDAKCAGLAEITSGSLKNVKDGAVLVLGTGIGGCLILNGSIRDGVSFRSGQFSSLYLEHGQWWDLCSLKGLEGIMRRHLQAERSFTGREIFQMAQNKEKAALLALKEYAGYLAEGIFNIQALLDLEKYAVGGGISAQPLLCSLLREQAELLFARNVEDTVKLPQIVVCKYHNDANLLGAYYGWAEGRNI